MTEADIVAVSAIRVTGWKAAHVGVVPQSYLDGMAVEADMAAAMAERVRKREPPSIV
jgi:hypothetical protein